MLARPLFHYLFALATILAMLFIIYDHQAAVTLSDEVNQFVDILTNMLPTNITTNGDCNEDVLKKCINDTTVKLTELLKQAKDFKDRCQILLYVCIANLLIIYCGKKTATLAKSGSGGGLELDAVGSHPSAVMSADTSFAV